MTKDEWQSIYNKLDEIYSQFYFAYNDYKNGRNKEVKKTAEREVDSAIYRADHYITENVEIYNLLTGEDNSTEVSRAFHYGEFLKSQYFGSDLSDLLRKIKTKINSYE